MKNHKSIIIQTIFIAIILVLGIVFIGNLAINLYINDMGINFHWLFQSAGFALSENSIPYEPNNSYLWALFVGWINSLKVIICGLFLATCLGFIAGSARVGRNPLLKQISSLYITLARQIPLLLQLLFWYFVAFLNLTNTPLSLFRNLILISNEGISIIGLTLSVEFSALLVGLTVFTGASIAEVVRGGLNSVSRGQWEAFRSLGITERLGMLKIIFPQALPAILPGLTSQYLNLAKNSTLAIAIGYADLYAVSDTTITQTGRSIEGFLLLMVSFLLLNLLISTGMEFINKISINSFRNY